MDTHIAFEGIIQGAGIPYAIVLYHVKDNDDREKIKKEPARRQVFFRMMMYAHTKS